MLRSALEIASQGWYVFPCATGTKRPALPGNWQRLATTDPGRIRDWWTYRPYNIGICCGPSGLVVIDLDVPKYRDADPATGVSTLTELSQRAGQRYPSQTFTVTTPSGGTHLYFRAPAVAIANSTSRLGPLIDVRAQGGYVLGPGSRVGGRLYTRVNAAIPAPLPAWIATALSQPPHPAAPSPLAVAGTAQAVPYGLTALREESARVATASEGTRNDTLNRAAFCLGQLVAGGCLPSSAVIDSLAEAARESGLGTRGKPDDQLRHDRRRPPPPRTAPPLGQATGAPGKAATPPRRPQLAAPQPRPGPALTPTGTDDWRPR